MLRQGISGLLQEFNLQIKDKKGVENVVADHLSRFTIAHDSHSPPINDEFREESLLLVENAPWYAHIANYLATGEIPVDWKAQEKKYFFAKIHSYYWKEPFLFKYCADQIIRRGTIGDSQPLPCKCMWRSFCFIKDSYEDPAIWFLLAIPFQRCSCHVPNLLSMLKTREAYSP